MLVRLRINPLTQDPLRDVIDGQQRLRAVFDFLNDEFPIAPEHNDDFGGLYFNQLPPKVRDSILKYRFYITELDDISDTEVLDLFARINIYNEKLSNQEIRNSQFFGQFKRCVYGISHSHYEFWRSNRIFTEQNIARMMDVEFTSELVIIMIDGLQKTNREDIDEFYKLYESKFPHRTQVINEFNAVIDIIQSSFGDYLCDSMFRRKPLFYSLFSSVYDARFGLPDTDRPAIKFNLAQKKVLAINLLKIEEKILADKLSKQYEIFYKASRAATGNPSNRKIRHNFIWKNAILPLARV